MRLSRYSIFCELNHKCYCFSTAKYNVLEVSSITNDLLLQGKFEYIPRGIIDILKRAEILVEDTYDELETFRAKLNYNRFRGQHFSLVIAPTLLCNFDCPYCFESQEVRARNSKISDETISNVINALETTYDRVNFHTLNTGWFGGEPLLAIDRISDISAEIKNFVDKHNIKYTASIYTNGFLLTEEVVKKLLDLNITYAKITFDGPREIHNLRRRAKDGRPTFDVILNNVKNALELGLKIRAQTNLDKTNIQQLPDLIQELKQAEIYDKVNIAFGHTSSWEYGTNPNVISAEKFNKICGNVEYEKSGHFTAPERSMVTETSCSADTINSLLVGPEGEIYTCMERFGDKNTIIGNINHGDYVDQKLQNAAKYMTYDPTSFDECKKCQLLPMCMGTCPYWRIQEKYVPCHPWKSDIQKYATDYVRAFISKNGHKDQP